MSFFCLALSALSALSPSIVQIVQCDFFICDPFAERDGTGDKIDFVYCQGYYPVPSAWRYLTFVKRFFFVHLFTTCINFVPCSGNPLGFFSSSCSRNFSPAFSLSLFLHFPDIGCRYIKMHAYLHMSKKLYHCTRNRRNKDKVYLIE